MEIKFRLSNKTNAFLTGRERPIIEPTDLDDMTLLVEKIEHTIIQAKRKYDGESITTAIYLTNENSSLETFAAILANSLEPGGTQLVFVEPDGGQSTIMFSSFKKDAL